MNSAIQIKGRTLGKAIDTLMKSEIAPLLADAGFSAQGRDFYRRDGELIQHIQLERFRFNNPLFHSFWFNLVLYFGDLQREEKITPKLLAQKAYPIWVARMAELFGGRNEMYTAATVEELPNLFQRIQDDLVRHALPFFGGLREVDEVLAFLTGENRRRGDTRHSFAIANVLARRGQLEESKPYFRESLGDPDAISRMARALGVEL